MQQLVQQVKERPEYSIKNLIEGGHTEAVTATIKKVAKLYGGVEQLDSEVGKECLRQLQSKFQKLSVGEILEAYRLYSSGDLGEIYSHNFGPKQFTAVLAAYTKDIRRKALADYYKQKDEEEKRKALEKARKAQAEYERTFPVMIEAQKGQPWQEMKSHWYDTAIRLGIIQEPTPCEKWEYMSKAKEEYIKEQQEQPKLTEGTFKALSFKEFTERTKDARIKTIAKQMILADRI